ncbi:conjugal transfer protein [Streptomyces sp. NPDC053560]|uniref:conjugal transfer protein n=1 Tax=Streptomyces sp. NPDC053560 TaxID=3365711 RepID=UPI0037D72888
MESAETGWATASTGAMANWTALIRWGAWALLLGGPLLGGWAMASAGATTVTPARVQPARLVSEDAVGSAGFAEQVVAAYVQAGQESGKELAAFYPPAADLTWSQEGGAQRVESTSPVRVRKVASGYWSVTVAARVTDEDGAKKKAAAGGLRFFQVPVRAEGVRWVAATLPAEVAAPTGGRVPELGYGVESAAVPSDPAVQTLQAFSTPT